jgi:hypothetical protein
VPAGRDTLLTPGVGGPCYQGGMSGLGDAASKIGEKVVEILDIFDLSFFISGAVVMAALLQFFGPLDKALDQLEGAGVFGLVLGSYVLGLVCFAVGRPVRTMLERKRARRADHELFHRALLQQGLGVPGGPGEALRRYFGHGVEVEDPAVRMAMYTRMWAHVRCYPELQQSFSLLNRYWVLSASYDGLAIAAFVWLLPVWQKVGQQGTLAGVGWAGLWTVAIFVALAACWHRAREYKRYQIEEIVATVAHWLSLVGRRELEGVGPASGRAASRQDANAERSADEGSLASEGD